MRFLTGKETLLLDYLSVCGDEDNIVKVEELLMNKLFINRERDILLGYTDAGVHKDDFGILINGRSGKSFCFTMATKISCNGIETCRSGDIKICNR